MQGVSEDDRYTAYIRSAKWRKKTEQVKRRDKYQCQTCLAEDRLEVHHKTYENLYHEPLGDLITLCRDCHEAITASIRERRYAKRELDPADVARRMPIYHERTRDVSPDTEVQDYRRSTPCLCTTAS